MAKNLEFTIGGDLFKSFRENFDLTLEEVIEDMIAKGCDQSSITAKIDIQLAVDEKGYNKTEKGSFFPAIDHTISSAMTVKSKRKGSIGGNLKMVYDDDTDRWVCVDSDNDQTSFVSEDGGVIHANCTEVDDDPDEDDAEDVAALPSAKTIFLPDNREAGN